MKVALAVAVSDHFGLLRASPGNPQPLLPVRANVKVCISVAFKQQNVAVSDHFGLLRASPEQVAQGSIFGFKRQGSSVLQFKEDHGRIGHGIGLRWTKILRRNTIAALDSRDQVSSVKADTNEQPPPGCTRVKVELKKPLGIVLEEDRAGNIFVAEVFEGGNAEKSGLVDVGDQLIATSAIVYGTEDYYQGVRVRKGMQIVRLSVFGEKFETVMAAIGTHPAYVKVVLEFQKCRMPQTQTENNGAVS